MRFLHHSRWLIFLPVLCFLLLGCNFSERQKLHEITATDTIKDELTRLRQRISVDPENASYHNQLASYYLRREILSDALHHINKAIEREPGNEQHLLVLSEIYLLMGDANRALTSLLKASELNSLNADVYAQLGRLEIILKDYPRALENIRKAISIDSRHSKAYFWRGYYHLEKSDTMNAINDLQVAVAADKDFFEGYLLLGQVLLAKHDNSASDYFDRALQVAPDDAETLYSFGMILQESGKVEQAKVAYHRILKADSSFSRAWYNLGYITLVLENDPNQALAYFNKSIELNPEYVDAIYNRGLIYEQNGDAHSARQEYRKVLKMQPDHEKAISGMNRIETRK